MATLKVISNRLVSKFQITDAAGLPIVGGCTTFYEQDKYLHAMMSSVEADLTAMWRMKVIGNTKDLDNMVKGTNKGLSKYINIQGTWNTKSFAMRFPQYYKLDEIGTFASSTHFNNLVAGVPTYDSKKKLEKNPAIQVAPSSAGNGEVYPISVLDKSKGHFLTCAKRLDYITAGISLKYSTSSVDLTNIPTSPSTAFSIPFVMRRIKTVAKPSSTIDEAAVGCYDNTLTIPYESYKILTNSIINKTTNITTSSYKHVSIPYAVDLFNVAIPSNDVYGAIVSNIGVSTQTAENTTSISSTDYVSQNTNYSLVFELFGNKPYASQFDDKTMANPAHYRQTFKDFANYSHVLGKHFDTKILDSTSSPVKMNIPIVTISGADYSTFYCGPNSQVSAAEDYNYAGPWHYDGHWCNQGWRVTYTLTSLYYKTTSSSQLTLFTFAKGEKADAAGNKIKEQMKVPAMQRLALWDHWYEPSGVGGSADAYAPVDPMKEGLSAASKTISPGLIKHAPFYMYDTVVSADKKTLYVLNVMADAFVFPLGAFGLDSDNRWINGYQKYGVDAYVARWSGDLTGVKSWLTNSTVNSSIPNSPTWTPDDPGPIWCLSRVGYLVGSWTQTIYIPAELPSRKLYCDALDISDLQNKVLRAPATLQFGQGKANAKGTKCPLSSGGLIFNPDTGVSTLNTKSGQNAYGRSEDADGVTKILDFKVIYMKKRVFVAILKTQWSGYTYAKCIGAISSENIYGVGYIKEFTLNYPDKAWIELWEMDFITNSFGHIDPNDKLWKADVPAALIDLGNNGYALPIIHRTKGVDAAKNLEAGGIKGYYGPSLNEVTHLEDFAENKGQFLQGEYTTSGFVLLYCPHNKWGKNIQLYTSKSAGNGTYYECKWTDTDKATNYLIAIEGVK